MRASSRDWNAPRAPRAVGPASFGSAEPSPVDNAMVSSEYARLMRRAILAGVALAATVAVTTAAAIAAPSKPATTAHKKVEHPSCASFFSVAAVAADIGPGTTIKALPATSGQFDFARHRIAGTGCELNWVNPTPTTPPVGDPDTQSGIGPGYWRVQWNLKPKVWAAQQAHEKTDPVECSGDCTITQSALQLGHGSKAFVETVTLPSQPTAPPIYYVYVYSAQHNFLEVYFWPVSLTDITTMIENLLSQKPHPAF
jgi:hypothetical protein